MQSANQTINGNNCLSRSHDDHIPAVKDRGGGAAGWVAAGGAAAGAVGATPPLYLGSQILVLPICRHKNQCTINKVKYSFLQA